MIPKYLYHYTSIEALEKILESGKIQFTRLDLLNDPLEGVFNIEEYGEVKDVRQCIYCSCWTANQCENISMWGIYGKFQGVRIKFKSNLFAIDSQLRVFEIETGFMPCCTINPIPYTIENISSGEPAYLKRVYGPTRVEYVNNFSETYSSVIRNRGCSDLNIPEGFINIVLQELGNRKIKDWAYEDEWRFKVTAFLNIIGPLDGLIYGLDELIAPEKVYVPYVQDPIEIMTGPGIDDKDFEKVRNIIKNSGKEINLASSKIKLNKK